MYGPSFSAGQPTSDINEDGFRSPVTVRCGTCAARGPGIDLVLVRAFHILRIRRLPADVIHWINLH